MTVLLLKQKLLPSSLTGGGNSRHDGSSNPRMQHLSCFLNSCPHLEWCEVLCCAVAVQCRHIKVPVFITSHVLVGSKASKTGIVVKRAQVLGHMDQGKPEPCAPHPARKQDNPQNCWHHSKGHALVLMQTCQALSGALRNKTGVQAYRQAAPGVPQCTPPCPVASHLTILGAGMAMT